MELREYMSVRRAYNLVRQETESAYRLTFEEFAILCRLDVMETPIKTSDIAEYQGALRPTMTHRTNHLANLGYIERVEGTVDRRNIVCTISQTGHAYVAKLAKQTRSKIPVGQPLARTSAERICKYVDTMGSVYCTAGQLVMLALYMDETDQSTITSLVERLGLLQPTVSMSVGSLVDKGLVARPRIEGSSARSTFIVLTEEGRESIQVLVDKIVRLVVRRRPRM
ncbi:MAG: MarR family transcriptional regulator [Coriobacteriales bacterium]|nr:MarR family transcriptional regulator [Coriobacteriales bacterium]